MKLTRSTLRSFGFLSLVFLSLLLLCQTSEAKDCFGALRKPLTDGGFSGSLDCDEVRPAFKKIGSITIGGKTYVVFDVRYKTVPQFPDAAVHGGQTILIFQNADSLTYLGRYNLSPPPNLVVSVTKTSIKAGHTTANGNEIIFTEAGPPKQALLDGYLVELSH